MSSGLSTCNVYGGGIKKKSQIRALKVADNRIGPVPKKNARVETTNNNANETT
jgi:hypothetical protein